jgi:integrase/recombinase XerD
MVLRAMHSALASRIYTNGAHQSASGAVFPDAPSSIPNIGAEFLGFTPKSVAVWLNLPSSEEKLIIWTLLDTGLRVSELCSLTPRHILWQQKAFRIQGKGGPYGKQSKRRVVPMSRRIQPLMEHYFAMHNAWFVGPRQVQKVVKRIANRAQITHDVTPHVLRHTFATLAIQKGISLAAIQKILGHDRLSTTAIYLNLTDTHIVEEYAQKW